MGRKRDGNEILRPKNISSTQGDIIEAKTAPISPTRDYLRINGPLSHKRNPSQSVMVRLKRLDTLRLNQRIKVKDYGYGSIQFLGCVHFAQGLFVGVELDEAKGKHDGSYHGKRYFTAKEKHGVLVKQHRVELLDIDTSNTSNIPNNNNDSQDINDLQHIDYDQFLFGDETEQISQKREDRMNDEKHNVVINELKIKNQALNDKIEEYMKTVDDLEVKLSNLETENVELKQEKLHFENEMNTKIEELEDQLEQIRIQLTTKDEVLKKQISNHENTKIKFRKKIKEHEELKQKNQDTVQLILYGDKVKDDVIDEYKKKEKNINKRVEEYILEMDRINIATQDKLNKRVEEWIFDYSQTF